MRSSVLEAVSRHAASDPDRVALTDFDRSLTWAELSARIETLSRWLQERRLRGIALFCDNGIDWIVTDLAACRCGITVVPIPVFFSPAQVQYLLQTVVFDALITDRESSPADGSARSGQRIPATDRLWAVMADVGAANDDGTCAESPAKITFTSGSTGQPKGVCLSGGVLGATAERLADALRGVGLSRHLCVTPLATLLENVAGVYVPLLLGATICAPSLVTVGLDGSSRLDVRRLARCVARSEAESIILSPQMLRDLSTVARVCGPTLRFAAVGGARVAAADLESARAAGLPAFQGYGLSECASVVTLNLPGNDRPGSVGRPLSGISIRTSEAGEICVQGQSMLGYLGEPRAPSREVATGDLGRIDDDGYLWVSGRRKHMFITSYGRNVSPEWPESELLSQPGIRQAIVYGEGRPTNTALLVPEAPDVAPETLAASVAEANRHLPDYARITDWFVSFEPLSSANGLLTPTGKPRREAIALRYFLNLPGRGCATPQTLPRMKVTL